MHYRRWLEKEGLLVNGTAPSEAVCTRLAVPLEDPGTERIQIKRLVVHHSATETGSAGCFRVLHRGINHWRDIGYHFVIGNGTITPDGSVEKGRRIPFRGAHARGANHDSLGICLVGNFDRGHPTRLQLDALGDLMDELIRRFAIESDSVTIHRLVKGSRTACPGGNLNMETIKKLLAR